MEKEPSTFKHFGNKRAYSNSGSRKVQNRIRKKSFKLFLIRNIQLCFIFSIEYILWYIKANMADIQTSEINIIHQYVKMFQINDIYVLQIKINIWEKSYA